jgi:hypothetical protein
MDATYARWLGILTCIAWAWLKAPTAHADPAVDFFARLGEQQAAFEAFQVNRRFFLCNAEAANANLFPAVDRSRNFGPKWRCAQSAPRNG